MDCYAVIPSYASMADIRDIVDYVHHVLHNFDAAETLYDNIREALESLRTLPMRHQILLDRGLADRNARMFPVGNYLIFYTVSEKEKIVNIVRILHSTQDWREILQTEN